jgi:hypothetical protein
VCKACYFFALVGNQNGNAHLRVAPCTWVRKSPAPRKKRALEVPDATASGTAVVTPVSVAESKAEPVPAVMGGSSSSPMWD